MRADTLPGRVLAVVSRRAPAFQPLPGERTGLAWALRTAARPHGTATAPRPGAGAAAGARRGAGTGPGSRTVAGQGAVTRPGTDAGPGRDTGPGTDAGPRAGTRPGTGTGPRTDTDSGEGAEQTVVIEPWRHRARGAAPSPAVAARLRHQWVLVGFAAVLALVVGGFALTAVVPTRWSPAGTTTATPTATDTTTTTSAAVTTVRRYFSAINGRDYQTAWETGGRNLGSDYSTFVRGFADLASDTVTATEARGDQVTVDLTARNVDGTVERYRATYTVVDGVITAGTAKRMS